MVDAKWGQPCQPGLNGAANITLSTLSTLFAVLVAEMDFHTRDAIRVISQRGFNHGDDILLQFDTAMDVAVSIDLNHHNTGNLRCSGAM
ncbi:MAG TPA: hypothetical protein VGE67_04375 [Haloferula sp.]